MKAYKIFSCVTQQNFVVQISKNGPKEKQNNHKQMWKFFCNMKLYHESKWNMMKKMIFNRVNHKETNTLKFEPSATSSLADWPCGISPSKISLVTSRWFSLFFLLILLRHTILKNTNKRFQKLKSELPKQIRQKSSTCVFRNCRRVPSKLQRPTNNSNVIKSPLESGRR